MSRPMSLGFAARIRQARDEQPPAKPIAHPLYPDRVAQRDRKTVLVALVRFLHTYGYWPATIELATMLDAEHGAVVHYLKALAVLGMAHKVPGFERRSFYELTPSGWTALGLRAIEPWIRRPKKILTRIAHKVTIDLADIAAAQRALEDRRETVVAKYSNAGRRRRAKLVGDEVVDAAINVQPMTWREERVTIPSVPAPWNSR